jgi:hypothetical protein
VAIPRWRHLTALAGCVLLSVALAIPLLVLFGSLNWLTWSLVCLVASLLALVAGLLGTAAVRLPLIVGGLVLAGLVALIPVGIL